MIKASLSIILAYTVSCSSYKSQPSENKNSDHSALIRVNNEQDLYEAFDQITDTKVIELKNRIYNLDKPLILNNLSHITINGNGAVLDADKKGRFFHLTTSSATLTLYSVTLQNGKTSVSVGAELCCVFHTLLLCCTLDLSSTSPDCNTLAY